MREDIGRFHQYRGYFLLLVGILTLWINISFLKPLVMGAIFAVVLFPLMNRLERLRLSPVVSAAIITVGFLFIILLPIGVIGVLGAEAALAKIQNLQLTTLTSADLNPSHIIETLHLNRFSDWLVDVSPISEVQVQQLVARAFVAGQTFLSRVFQDVLTGLPGMVFSNVVILLTLFFLLLDGPRAVRFIRGNSFLGEQSTVRILSTVRALCHSVLVSSVATGAVQGFILSIACLITRTPSALLLGFLTFITSFVPVIGSLIVTLSLVFHAIFVGDITSAVIFLVSIAVIGLAENIVRPYVLKGGAELHPLIGFVAAFGALDTLGFYGLFIGPVVAGLFFALLPMVARTYPKYPRLRG